MLLESFSDLRLHQLVDPSTVDDWRLPSLLRCFDAVKPDQHGPTMHVGALVVKKNRLFSRIWGRPIDLAPLLCAREITIIAEQLWTDGGGKPFKLRYRSNLYPSEKDRSMTQQMIFNQ